MQNTGTTAPSCSPLNLPGFSADTEILTRARSWVPFDQLAETDEIAVRIDGKFTWLRPPKVTWRPYQGDMLRSRSRTADLMVTPATSVPHMNRQRVRGADGVKELPAVERPLPAYRVPASGVALIAASAWFPVEAPPTKITLKATRACSYGGRLAKKPKDFTVTTADFAAFMGMYLAEGCLNGSGGAHTIDISQNNGGRVTPNTRNS